MKIAQAAKQLDLSTATLRYYENIGLIRKSNVTIMGFVIIQRMIFNGLNLSSV